MRKVILGMAAVAALTTASASQAQINFGSGAGDTGVTSKTYSDGTYSVTAYGCSDLTPSCIGNETNLYEKNLGAGEMGIGLANDPSGNGEIWNDQKGETSAIILDVLGLTGATSASFTMGSTTAGEDFNLLGWNGGGWDTLLNGSADGTYALTGFGTYRYFAFTTDGTVNAGAPNSFGNVLLESITVPVPEPSTWAMMLLGFAGIGFAARRNRRQVLAQVA